MVMLCYGSMQMQDRRIYRRLPERGRLIVALVVALAGCQAQRPDGADERNAADDPVMNLPALPLPAEPMRRAELLSAIQLAASAAASGVDDSAEQRELDGRQFEFRIRFGCAGPSPDLAQASLGWTFEPAKRTLRVRVAPTIAADDQIVSRVAGEDVEAVEGFWVPRPWLLHPACPAAASAGAEAARPRPDEDGSEPRPGDTKRTRPDAGPNQASAEGTVSRQKVGIAQFFTPDDSRTRRRDARPYETVKVLPADQPAGAGGYDFILSGRLRALPKKGVIECVPRGPDRPPDCIVSAQIDRVWIEQPESKQIVAEWSN